MQSTSTTIVWSGVLYTRRNIVTTRGDDHVDTRVDRVAQCLTNRVPIGNHLRLHWRKAMLSKAFDDD